MADLDVLRESIELALAPPPVKTTGRARRVLRRIVLRLGQPLASHQQQIDRQLLAVLTSFESRLEGLDRSVVTGLDELSRWLTNTNVRLKGLEGANEDLRTWSHDLAGQASGFAAQASVLTARVDALEGHLGPIHAFVTASRTAPDPDALDFERFDAGAAGRVIGYQRAARTVAPDEDYVAFEDVFRLSEDVIRERQRPYLSLLGGREPVLDAGCGRGEFLELLRAEGVPARGVDLDPGMVERARAKGLDVERGDAVTYLERLPNDSLGVVFAAQVVEHLPYERLLAFLRLSYQKLQPGGLIVTETVNPHAPGALKNFWLDLTHQHPIFPEVLLTICRGIGFESAYIFHPGASGDVDADREHAGDYAMVAELAKAE